MEKRNSNRIPRNLKVAFPCCNKLYSGTVKDLSENGMLIYSEVNLPIKSRFEVLILVTDSPSEQVLKDLAEVNQLLPLPIIIFSENESPNVIQQAIKSGVSAYVVNEMFPQRLQSIISVANERFKAVQSLRNELKQAKTQLESRKYIDRAKGLIMEQKSISENEAYSTLRKMAMDQGCSLATVSKNIIDVCQLLSPARV